MIRFSISLAQELFDLYRLLVVERKKERLAEAERMRVLRQHRRERHLPAS